MPEDDGVLLGGKLVGDASLGVLQPVCDALVGVRHLLLSIRVCLMLDPCCTATCIQARPMQSQQVMHLSMQAHSKLSAHRILFDEMFTTRISCVVCPHFETAAEICARLLLCCMGLGSIRMKISLAAVSMNPANLGKPSL